MKIGEGFHAVIFAMGVDDVVKVLRGDKRGPGLFKQLPPRWSEMAEHSRTVATQAAQVWLDADFRSLGWQAGPGIVTALGLSFDTWADMTHTLATERAWRRAKDENPTSADRARSVAYFCSVLPDQAIAEKKGETNEGLVVAALEKMLEKDAQVLWPTAFAGGLSAINRFVEPQGSFDRKYLPGYDKANAVGSDRYTLSTPGSLASRISPLDRSVANMTIAGDWTACGLDAGCVEAAVMSGMLAAHAITGSHPSLASIIGYDHP